MENLNTKTKEILGLPNYIDLTEEKKVNKNINNKTKESILNLILY